MNERRIERLNSLLKEVISDVIHKEMKNPHLPPLVTVTNVLITKDLRHAKVYVSIIGDREAKIKAISILQSASGFIALHSSKQVVMRFFPDLMFILDESVEKQMQIDSLISKIQKERESRENKE
jgi:ribosome-binding factor A